MEKSFFSRGVRLFREGVKRGCAKSVALLGGASYSLFGIPSGLSSLEGEIEMLYTDEKLLHKPPKGLESELFWRFRGITPPLADGILTLGRATATRLGGNLDGRGKLVTTFLQPIDGKPPHRHDLFRFSTKNFLPRVYKTERPVVTLAAGWQGAFYHWIFEVLPRLHLIEKGGYQENQIYVEAAFRFQKESLDLLEVTSYINAKEYDAVQTPQLIVPSTPGVPMPWACQFLRDKLLPKLEKKAPYRLYLSRSDAAKRRILNEEEVLKVLKRFGFQKVEMVGLSLKEQMEAFYAAEMVVGPHGAGFSHLAFCEPNTPVLEIFSPAYVNVCYWQVCNQVGLDYYYLFGEGERYPDGFDPHLDPDIVVDIDKLTAMLKSMGC